MENRLNISVNKIKDIPNVDFTNKEYVDENLGRISKCYKCYYKIIGGSLYGKRYELFLSLSR